VTETAEPLASSSPPPPPPSPRTVRNRWIIFGLVALTLIVYWPVGRFDFINYDDPKYITDNPEVVDGLTWDSFKQSFRSTQGGYRHPLTWWSHLLDVSLFGLNNPGGHHNTSLILHTVNVVLLWWVLLRLTGAAWPSAWVAAILAVHPTHLESVAWISERKDTLSLLFLLLTVWAYQRYTEKPGIGRYAVVALGFVAALMAKPIMVTLPVALLLLDLWPLRRIRPGAGAGRALGRCLLEKLPLLVLSALSAVITITDSRSLESFATLERFPLDVRLQTSILGYARYLGLLLWPTKLAIFYPYPSAGWPMTWVIGSAVLLVAITAACLWQVKRRPYLLAGWLFFVLMLSPVIGLLPSGDASLADRYTYVSSIGICFALAWLARDLGRRVGARAVVGGLGVATVVACAAVSMAGVWHWRDSLSIMSRALAVTEENWTAHTNYATALMAAGRASEAEPHLRAALKYRPEGLDQQLNLAIYLIDYGSLDEARSILLPLAQQRPGEPMVIATLGQYFARLGQHDRAIQYFDAALAQRPRKADVMVGKAFSLLTLNRVDEAEELLVQAVQIQDNLPRAHHRLGLIALSRNDVDAATQYFQRAIELGDYPQPHYDYGVLLARLGRFEEAHAELEQAIKLYPANAYAERGQARLQMGFLLLRLNRPDEAKAAQAEGVDLLRRAAAASPKDALPRYQLAQALLALKDPAATQAAAEALQVAEASNNLFVASQIKARFPALTTQPATQPATTRAVEP
jgi:tetratricopeptide (TPR) repeat protein